MNDFANFTILHGVLVSIFMMLIVFMILFLLSVLLGSLKYLIRPEEKKQTTLSAKQAVSTDLSQDECAMVAMLVASCVAKQELKQDVRVISCKCLSN